MFDFDLFCVRFNQLIEEKGISQLELSKAMNLSQPVISKLKKHTGQAPSADTIYLIAKYFNVSTDWLLGLTNIRSTDKATKELCDTLGLDEEFINHLKKRTALNDALNFLFTQHSNYERVKELNSNNYDVLETTYKIDNWTAFSIMNLLTEFVELFNSGIENDVYYKLTSDGTLSIGKAAFDKSRDFDNIKTLSTTNTNVNSISIAGSIRTNRMQRILSLLNAQLQTFIEDFSMFYIGEEWKK